LHGHGGATEETRWLQERNGSGYGARTSLGSDTYAVQRCVVSGWSQPGGLRKDEAFPGGRGLPITLYPFQYSQKLGLITTGVGSISDRSNDARIHGKSAFCSWASPGLANLSEALALVG
jgi:hypothetical protein